MIENLDEERIIQKMISTICYRRRCGECPIQGICDKWKHNSGRMEKIVHTFYQMYPDSSLKLPGYQPIPVAETEIESILELK